MKRVLVLFLIMAICLGSVACGSNQDSSASSNSSDSNVVEANVETQQVESDRLVKGRYYYEYVEAVFDVMKEKLKHPASLEIEAVIVCADKEYNSKQEVHDAIGAGVSVYVAYSAKNDYGNENSKYACYNRMIDMDTNAEWYSTYYKTANGRNSNYEEVSDGYYIGTSANSFSEGRVCFEVDLEDYENEGYLLP